MFNDYWYCDEEKLQAIWLFIRDDLCLFIICQMKSQYTYVITKHLCNLNYHQYYIHHMNTFLEAIILA